MNNAQDATAAKNQKSKISSNSRTDKKRSGSKRQMNSLWNGQHWKNTHCHQSQGVERHNQRGQLIFAIHSWWSGSRRGAEKMFNLQVRTLAGRVGRRGVDIRESCTLCSLQYIFQHGNLGASASGVWVVHRGFWNNVWTSRTLPVGAYIKLDWWPFLIM